MIDRIQLAAIAASVLLLFIVLELVRRRKLIEEYSFLWIISAVVLLGLSARREFLGVVARSLGVYYPPILLVMLLMVIVLVASLCFSVIVSRQRQQIERLIEETAILSAEVRDLRSAHRRTDPAADGAQTGEPYMPAPNRRRM